MKRQLSAFIEVYAKSYPYFQEPDLQIVKLIFFLLKSVIFFYLFVNGIIKFWKKKKSCNSVTYLMGFFAIVIIAIFINEFLEIIPLFFGILICTHMIQSCAILIHIKRVKQFTKNCTFITTSTIASIFLCLYILVGLLAIIKQLNPLCKLPTIDDPTTYSYPMIYSLIFLVYIAHWIFITGLYVFKYGIQDELIQKVHDLQKTAINLDKSNQSNKKLNEQTESGNEKKTIEIDETKKIEEEQEQSKNQAEKKVSIKDKLCGIKEKFQFFCGFRKDASQIEIFRQQLKMAQISATVQLVCSIIILLLQRQLGKLETSGGVPFLICNPERNNLGFCPSLDDDGGSNKTGNFFLSLHSIVWICQAFQVERPFIQSLELCGYFERDFIPVIREEEEQQESLDREKPLQIANSIN